MPPNWPTPTLEHYLFENGWMLPLMLLVVGAIVFMVARQRADRRWVFGAIGVWTAAILAAVLAMAVTTDREALMARTREVADTAVGKWDTEKMKSFLSREFRYDKMDRKDIDTVIARVSSTFKIKGYTPFRVMANCPQKGFGQSYMNCWVDLEAKEYGAQRVPMQWLLDWRLEDGQWRIIEVRDGMIYDQPANEELLKYVR